MRLEFLSMRQLAFAVAMVGALASARADTGAGLAAFRAGRFADAYQAWREAADTGDATAALYLGVSYDAGIGVPQDYQQAVRWYERSAQGGSPVGMLNAGIMYDAGRGVPMDPAAAAAWYERAAAAGNGRAAYNLGLMYEAGSGVALSRAQAVRYYKQAASRGIEAATTRLRALGAVTAGAARVNVTRASEDPALTELKKAQADLLERGVGDAEEAFGFFKAGAEAGNALAAYNLAYDYQHGIGVRASMDDAINWYRKSAAYASDPAIKELARQGLRSALELLAHAQR